MYRSFSDRVLGGVCGGVAARLPLNVWLLRVLFIVLAGLSLGAFAVLYLMLWLVLPQESLVGHNTGGAFWLLVTVILFALVTANWAASLNGLTRTEAGDDLFYPLLLLLLSAVFFVEQVRRWVR